MHKKQVHTHIHTHVMMMVMMGDTGLLINLNLHVSLQGDLMFWDSEGVTVEPVKTATAATLESTSLFLRSGWGGLTEIWDRLWKLLFSTAVGAETMFWGSFSDAASTRRNRLHLLCIKQGLTLTLNPLANLAATSCCETFLDHLWLNKICRFSE